MIMPASDPTRIGSSPVSGTGGAVVLSLSETEALCSRAARGAGFDWGHSEEAGRAGAWLARKGLAGCALVLRCLQMQPLHAPKLQPGRWAGGGVLCPLRSGTALADHANLPDGLRRDALALETTALPVLLLPFVARAAGLRGCAVALSAPGVALRIRPDGGLDDVEAVQALARLDAARIVLRPDPDTIVPAGTETPMPALPATPMALWRALDKLALRATVPPSESSLADAGGSGSDND